MHQAAAAGAAAGDDLQGADHVFATAGQGEGQFGHAAVLPFLHADLVAQVVIDLVAVHVHAGAGGVVLAAAFAAAGAGGIAAVLGGGVLAEHAGRLAPLGGAAPGGLAGRGARLRVGQGLFGGSGLGGAFFFGHRVLGLGHAGGVDGRGDRGGHQGFERFGAFARGLDAGRRHGRALVVAVGLAQEVHLHPRAAAAAALGRGQFQLGGVQQRQHEQDVHQQAGQGADPALPLFDVDVFPVQRVEQRRARAAGRVAHVGVRAGVERDFIGGGRQDLGRTLRVTLRHGYARKRPSLSVMAPLSLKVTSWVRA